MMKFLTLFVRQNSVNKKFKASFGYEANPANNQIFYGWELLTEEVSFSGQLYSWMHIGQNQAFDYKDKMYRLVIASQKGRLRAVYLLDKESQVFANLIEPSKRPLLYKGIDELADVTDPEYDGIKGGHLTRDGKRFSLGPIDMKLRPDEKIFMTSVYMRFRIFNYPSTGSAALIRFVSDHTLVVKVGGVGDLQFFGSGGIITGYSATLSTNVWYDMVVTLARVDLEPRTLGSYMMIEINADGNLADGKSDFDCKKI
jgi:hypothetical protein